MATITTVEFPRASFSFPRALRNMLIAFQEAQARRAAYYVTRAELSAMSNRELSDIGISRGEIEEIARAAMDQA